MVRMGLLNLRLVGLSLWISVMWMTTTQNFKLWHSNVTSEDVTRAEAQDIFVLTAHCVGYDRVGLDVTPHQTRNLARCGKT